MIDSLRRIPGETWWVLTAMAPYLLLGFLLAGLLSQVFTGESVRRHMGGRRLWTIIKASLLGVPLPLCSCGVLPLAAAIRRQGGSRGATMSFLVSTPQTGVDSILITHALLGPVFTVVRVLVAFLSGILCGVVVESVSRPHRNQQEDFDEQDDCLQPVRSRRLRIFAALHYGFVVLANDIGRATLAGILLAGVLTGFFPEDFWTNLDVGSLGTMLVMVVIGIPLYVCSSGSVPLAYAFIGLGVSPGAALAFLIAGPASNTASVTMVWKVLGRTACIVYLVTIAFCAVGAGLLLDGLMPQSMVEHLVHRHPAAEAGMWKSVCAVVLLGVLLPTLRPASWKK